MRTKYAIMITVAIIIIAVVAIFWKDITVLFKGVSGGSDNTNDVATPVFPLKQGSKGSEVKQLQRYLNRQKAAWQTGGVIIPQADLIVDGMFGPKTQAMAEAVHVEVPITEDFYNQQIKNI